MTRSAEFGFTVKGGVRVAQPDLVVHARHLAGENDGPRIGFVVSKAVGNAVERHRVARRLRHAVRPLVGEFGRGDRMVVRALPSSRDAASAELQSQLVAGVRRAKTVMERNR
jgi:ribonuclease P protein component